MKAVNTVSGQIPVKTSEITEATEAYNFFNTLNERKIADFNFIRFIVHPGLQSQLDKHTSKECWYIAAGEGLLTIDNKRMNIKQGELYFFDSYAEHIVENTSSSNDLEILSVWW